MDLMDVTLTRINKQTAEDPYASMEKDQLISMIHFLVKREDEPTNEASAEPNSFELCIARRRKNIIQRAQENQELKDMVKELRDTHKLVNKDAKVAVRLFLRRWQPWPPGATRLPW